jgi:hypothetical protein
VSLMLSSVSLALPVTWRSVCERRSVKFSNIARSFQALYEPG